MTLTQIQKDLLFGTLLGDGNLHTNSSGGTWRYRATHAIVKKDYLFHKYGILKNLCGSPPFMEKKVDIRTGVALEKKTTFNYSFNTLIHPSLCFYGNMFYTYDKRTELWVKDVPIKIEQFLTPCGLAYLYMDDGSLKWLGHSNAMCICTESFSHDGVKRLQNALKHSFNIHTTVNKKQLKNPNQNGASREAYGLRVFIPEKSSADFRELIKPYLVDCMKYKVSDGQKGHL